MVNNIETEQQVNRLHTSNRSVVVGGEREWLIWDENNRAVDLSNIFGTDPQRPDRSKTAGPKIKINEVYFSTKDEEGGHHYYKLKKGSRMNDQKGHLDWHAKLIELKRPDVAKDSHLGNWDAEREFVLDSTTMSQDNITVGFGVYYFDESGQQVNLGVADKIAAPRESDHELLAGSDLPQLSSSGEIFSENV